MVADTCSGDGSFTITANAAPNLDGCFKDTGSSTKAYTVSSTATQNEVVVFAFETEAVNVSRKPADFVQLRHTHSLGAIKLLLMVSRSACSFGATLAVTPKRRFPFTQSTHSP